MLFPPIFILTNFFSQLFGLESITEIGFNIVRNCNSRQMFIMFLNSSKHIFSVLTTIWNDVKIQKKIQLVSCWRVVFHGTNVLFPKWSFIFVTFDSFFMFIFLIFYINYFSQIVQTHFLAYFGLYSCKYVTTKLRQQIKIVDFFVIPLTL